MSKDVSISYSIDDLVAMYIILDYHNRKKESEKGTVIKAICKRGDEDDQCSKDLKIRGMDK